MLSALSSLWFVVSSPPPVPSNLSSMPVDQLDRVRDALVPFRDADLSIIVWATVLVTIGVLMEVAEIQHDVREAVRELKHQSKLGDLKPVWKMVVAVGWVLVAFGLGLEWWGDARINSVSTDLDRVNQAIVQRAQGDATAAGKSAHDAGIDATTARDSARDAKNDAKGARQEADSLTQEITDAKQQSANASSRAADAVSRLADAEQRLANAMQREVGEEEEINRLKSPRQLMDVAAFADQLKKYPGTEYTFPLVAPDGEALAFLRQIDAALQLAGWKRVKPDPTPTVGVKPFDNEPDFQVGIGPAIGIEVQVDSTLSVDSLRLTPEGYWPQLVLKAAKLRNALASDISPKGDNVRKDLVINPGSSSVVKIMVGRKP